MIKTLTWPTIKPIQTNCLAVHGLHKIERSLQLVQKSRFSAISGGNYVEILFYIFSPKCENLRICHDGYLHFLRWRCFSLVLRNLFVFFLILTGNRFMFYRRRIILDTDREYEFENRKNSFYLMNILKFRWPKSTYIIRVTQLKYKTRGKLELLRFTKMRVFSVFSFFFSLGYLLIN